MEGPRELTDRIENDVDKILKMYDVAAKLYPYENIHGERAATESEQRQNLQKFAQEEAPEKIILQGSPLPLAFVYLMSRGGAKGLLDFSPIFKQPARAFGWLLLGNSILMMWRLQYAAHVRENNAAKSQLHMRVNNNEQTHAILKTLKFHLSTRKMGVFEIDPR